VFVSITDVLLPLQWKRVAFKPIGLVEGSLDTWQSLNSLDNDIDEKVVK
jgi:hypothetical protein